MHTKIGRVIDLGGFKMRIAKNSSMAKVVREFESLVRARSIDKSKVARMRVQLAAEFRSLAGGLPASMGTP